MAMVWKKSAILFVVAMAAACSPARSGGKKGRDDAGPIPIEGDDAGPEQADEDAGSIIDPDPNDDDAGSHEHHEEDAGRDESHACASTVSDCGDLGSAREQAIGCCEENVAVFCDNGTLRKADCQAWSSECGMVAEWNQVWCEPNGLNACAEVVAPTSSGEVLEYETVNFNWDMACWDDADDSMLVFVEDTANTDVALRFYYWANMGIAGGDTIDLNSYSSLTRPFLLETLSGVNFDNGGSYDGEFLAYAGTLTFTQLASGDPSGTDLIVEIRDLWAREIEVGTRTCSDVAQGRRMHIERLNFTVRIAPLHNDGECQQWAGG